MSHNYRDLYDNFEADMLQDADNAITSCGLWDWLAQYTPEDGKGFMFSEHPNLTRINNAMKYGGHSGSSYAWTMRQMEYIAKNGWTLFEFNARERIRKDEESKRLKQLTSAVMNADQIINTAIRNSNGTLNPLHVAEASRGVPGFEGQADAMKRFSEGKMTYAEMRSLCG